MSAEERNGGRDLAFLDEKERKFLDMFLARAPEMRSETDALLADLAQRRACGDEMMLWHALTDRHIADPDTADDILDSIKYERIIEGMRKGGLEVKMPLGREDHLFARLALQKSVMSVQQLEEAVRVQNRLLEAGVVKPLGEVVFDAEILEKEPVETVVEILRQKISLRGTYRFPAFRISDDQDTRLGAIFRSDAAVPESEIADALQLQERLLRAGIWKPLGEILFERGAVTEQQLHIALGMQAAARSQRTPRRRRGRFRPSALPQIAIFGGVAIAAGVVILLVFNGNESKVKGPSKSGEIEQKRERIPDEAPDAVSLPEPNPADPGGTRTSPARPDSNPKKPPSDGLVEFEGRRMKPEERERIILARFADAVRKAAEGGFEPGPDGSIRLKEGTEPGKPGE